MGILSSFCGLLQNRKYPLLVHNESSHYKSFHDSYLRKIWGSSFHLVFALCLFYLPFHLHSLSSIYNITIVIFENLTFICIWQIYSPVHRHISRAGERSKGGKNRTRHSLSSDSPITHATGPCLYRMFHLYSDTG